MKLAMAEKIRQQMAEKLKKEKYDADLKAAQDKKDADKLAKEQEEIEKRKEATKKLAKFMKK